MSVTCWRYGKAAGADTWERSASVAHTQPHQVRIIQVAGT